MVSVYLFYFHYDYKFYMQWTLSFSVLIKLKNSNLWKPKFFEYLLFSESKN